MQNFAGNVLLLVFAKSPSKLRERMPEILENADEDLTPRMRNLLALLWNEWKYLESFRSCR